MRSSIEKQQIIEFAEAQQVVALRSNARLMKQPVGYAAKPPVAARSRM